MTPERFRQIRNLFEAALDRDGDARVAFLEEAAQGDPSLRKEVERLLAAHQQGTGLLEQGVRPELLTGEPDRMEGRRIDHYEILRELGHGGMGSVYLAARTDGVYRKPVALKVVRPEAGRREVIERFRQERQILAALDHPNIARLLDGGSTPEGLPYLVMEYVEGQPIDTYCDERKLTVTGRLELFRTVCAAVEYAHQRGVVHRDLKPGNILVTGNGTVKLLDFGVAKLLRSDPNEITAAYVTRTGMHLMTPEYASPEQVRGEAVGAASDIYSLGVILYELLTGHRPYRLSSRLIHEVVRVISEEDPKPPSTAISEAEQSMPREGDKPMCITPESVSQARGTTPAQLRRELAGDLDKIALKAVRKEPPKRYATAEAFGEDVRRHVEGQPVAARGGGVLYRIGKLLRRDESMGLVLVVLLVWWFSGERRWALLTMFIAPFLIWYFMRAINTWRARDATHESAAGPVSQVLLLVMIAMGIGAWAAMVALRAIKPGVDKFDYVMLLLTVPWTVWSIIDYVLWFTRRRAAGPRLLGLGGWRPNASGAYILATGAFILLMSFHRYRLWRYSFGLCSDAPAGLCFSFLGLNMLLPSEIRRRGVFFRGRLIPWHNIEYYTWAGCRVPLTRDLWLLELRLNRRFAFGRRASIRVPGEQKDAVESILSQRHLQPAPAESANLDTPELG